MYLDQDIIPIKWVYSRLLLYPCYHIHIYHNAGGKQDLQLYLHAHRTRTVTSHLELCVKCKSISQLHIKFWS